MQTTTLLLIGLSCGVSATLLTYFALRPQIQLYKKQANEEQTQRLSLQQALQVAQQEKAQWQAQTQIVQERLHMTQNEANLLREQLQKEFERMASHLLEEKSVKFALHNQTQVQQILQPLQEKIQLFEKQLADQYQNQAKEQAALREHLRNLMDLNKELSAGTENLTKALKGDPKFQGNWGELILERVLEQSGLEKGREYEVQYSTIGTEGQRLMPDVLLHLPGQKKIVIDSKVSLTAYERARKATEAAEIAQERKMHLRSLKNHIDQLSEKAYWQSFQPHTLEFVLLFVPIEPALAWALEEQPSLYEYAFTKQIILVGPTTLLATLRTIDSMWKQEKQQMNAQKIAHIAAKIYDKFHGVITDFEKVSKKLDESKEAYDAAWQKLTTGKGNMLSQVESLRRMGVQPKKQLEAAHTDDYNEDDEQA